VAAAVSAGTRRVYTSYWNRVLEHWGTRRLDEPSPSEVKQLAEHVKTHTVQRRNARGGRSAAEHLIAALRCLYIGSSYTEPSPNSSSTTQTPHENWPPPRPSVLAST
jgi:hypothetical protein